MVTFCPGGAGQVERGCKGLAEFKDAGLADKIPSLPEPVRLALPAWPSLAEDAASIPWVQMNLT